MVRTTKQTELNKKVSASLLLENGFGKNSLPPITENLYLSCLLKATKEFIEEEIEGHCCTELRLIKKIEAARTLFPEERKRAVELYKTKFFGR